MATEKSGFNTCGRPFLALAQSPRTLGFLGEVDSGSPQAPRAVVDSPINNMTTAADLTNALIVQRERRNRMDDWEEESGQWEAMGMIRAAIETDGAGRAKITTRNCKWIKVTDRLFDQLNGVIYHIESIANFDHRKGMIDIFCQVG